MIHKRTVLILGAGASVPYGFPTGKELVEKILTLTSQKGDPRYQCLCDAGATRDEIADLRHGLDATQFDSIDRFLEFHPELIPVGKLAIAATLIPCEDPVLLIKSRSATEHWYRLLFQQMTTNKRFNWSKLGIISLNYDRSLQQYLYDTLIRDLRVRPDEAARTVLNMDFAYLHGRLGDLPWRPLPGGEERPFSREYGTVLTPELVKGAADSIQIISEVQWHQGGPWKHHVTTLVAEAAVIGFVGFGYHRDVIDRLELARRATGVPQIEWYGSACGLPQARQKELRGELVGLNLGSDKHDALAFLQHWPLVYQGTSYPRG